jgi:hypothetical protein
MLDRTSPMSTRSADVIPAGSGATQLSIWRFFRPSLSDMFFLFVIFWLCLAGAGSWQALLRDGDTGMHLRSGDWIVAHRQVPMKDLFSYTQPGSDWYAFQWGSAVLYSLLNASWGLKGIVFLAGITAALWVTIMMQAMIRIGVHGIMACILALAAGNAASIHYHARPHLFTMLFLAVSVLLVEEDRIRPSPRIWLLVGLAAMWANLHSGFVILFAYLAVVALGTALQQWVNPADRPAAKRYVLVAAASLLATLVNPYGIRLHLHILKFIGGPVATQFVDEYQSPQFRSEPAYWFLVLLFGTIMVAGAQLYRKRFVEPLGILVFGAIALISARNIPLFLTVVLPLAGRALTEIWSEFTSTHSRTSSLSVLYREGIPFAARFSGITVWAGIAIVFAAIVTPATSWPTDFDPKYFPLKLWERNITLLQTGRVLTTDQWGDYLIYRFKGQKPVFLDGRSDFYREKVVRDYLAMIEGQPQWREKLDEYRIDVVLIAPLAPLRSLLLQDSQWSLKDSDTSAVIFSRNAGASSPTAVLPTQPTTPQIPQAGTRR